MLRRIVDEIKGKKETVLITTMPNDKSPLIARTLRVAWITNNVKYVCSINLFIFFSPLDH